MTVSTLMNKSRSFITSSGKKPFKSKSKPTCREKLKLFTTNEFIFSLMCLKPEMEFVVVILDIMNDYQATFDHFNTS